jgi:hypothetical protein
VDLRGRKLQEAGEDCIMRSFTTCTLHQILLGCDQDKKDKIGGHVVRMGDKTEYKILIGKAKWRRPFGR